MASSTTTNHAAAWLFVGAILVGGVTAAYLYTREPDPSASGEVAAIAQDNAAGSETTTAPESGEAAAPASTTEDTAAQTADSGEAALPRFDILRVEQDGSAVVAGTAQEGSMVVLMANGEEIASGTAGAGGDFAIVLEEPLAKGDYELTLQATDSTGKSITSKETGVVSVPEEGGELLAIVTEQGKASRVMQAPAGETEQSQSAATDAPAAEMAAKEKPADEKAMETAKLDQGNESAMTKDAAPAEGKQAVQPTLGQDTNIAPVLVQAVDVDGGNMFIAGSGAPNRDINIYLDDDYLGTTKVTAGGTFLLEAAKALDSGNYTIRADMLAENGATVDRRASVELQHQVDTQTALQETSADEKPAGLMETAKVGLEAMEEKAAEMAKAATDLVEKDAAEVVDAAKTAAGAVEGKAAEVMDTAKTEVKAAEEKATEMGMAATEAVEKEAAEVMQASKSAAKAVEEKAVEVIEKAEAEVVAGEEKAEEIAAEVMEAVESEAEAVEEKAAEAMEMAEVEANAAEEKAEEMAAEVMKEVEIEAEAVEESAVDAVEKMAADSTEIAPKETATLSERMEQKPSDGEQAENTDQVASAQQTQAPVIQSGASVIIRRGDNLWRISRRMLGKGVQYTVIFDANRDQIEDPDLIFPGQVFDVPGGVEADQG